MKAICLIYLIFSLKVGYAHVPIFPDQKNLSKKFYTLQRPYEKSVALYTYLSKPKEMHLYEFYVEENDLKEGSVEILIGTLVPACPPLKNLLINWTLLGPKQDAINEALPDKLKEKISLEDNQAARTMINKEQGSLWKEPYTSHYYFWQKRLTLRITKTGHYKIYLWATKDQIGDYVLEFGHKELWTLKDILYTLWVYPKLLLEAEIQTPDCKTTSMIKNH